ncbi:TPA: hypothetical protein IAB95_03080 [Candidatus Ventrenecus avicola]|nr:hypothetical protein [Candidatus Ventrenecus avicola]
MDNNENDALEQSENESIPEEVEQELDSLAEESENQPENIPANMTLNTMGKEAIVSGSKKVIAMLLKKKFLFVALIAGGILLFIILFVAVMDSSGVDDYVFVDPVCETVTVHYNPYGPEEETTFTMGMEEYVEAAVLAYTKDLNTSTASTYHLYFSLSVALRNEAMTHNCEVTYRDVNLQQVTERDNYYFTLAMENSYGIVMVDENEEFVEANVSSFCWSSMTEAYDEEMGDYFEYSLIQPNGMIIPSYYVDSYFNNPVYQNCECNLTSGVEMITRDEYNNQDQCYFYWYEEEEGANGVEYRYYREYQHQENASAPSYSLYAANYLYRTGGNYNTILAYFFGEDIVLRTTQEENTSENDNAPSTNCSTFSLTTTTLSRDEFIERMQSYSHSDSDWATFQQNAGTIYDIATSNGVNPEIIVVRAILEGFSPGGSSHNYWGINCTNTGGGVDCRDYGSFDDGVLAMAELVKSYDSFDDMMSRYAYIGAYWYDDDIPNASGVGGCYYFESIRDYMSSERASEVANICATTTCTRSNTGNCTPTTDEDQQAYAEFQKANMTNQRFRVFGIEEDACTNDVLTDGNCIIYAQGDSRWGSHYLGNSTSTTLHESGCAVTSVAIALTCTGQVEDVSNFSPLVLNNTLVRTGGFDGSLIVWNNGGIREFVPTFRVAADYGLGSASIDVKLSRLAAANEHDNWIGIAHISNAEHSSHFVVISSYNEVDNTFVALDPAGGVINTYSIHDLDRIIYYTY